jgi:predicted transcriptional regulator
MRETVCISLPGPIKQKLDKISKLKHCDRSSIIKEALNQYLVRQEFRKLRDIMVPKAERKGIFTDEDVFKIVS